MKIQQQIEKKITEGLRPSHLEIYNESHMHNVPPGSESHFKVVVVSNEFDGVMRVEQHRMVNAILEKELKGNVHALALHTMTPTQWMKKEGKTEPSPQCLGGSKK